MSIKDALNYTVKTNSTGLKRPSMSSEEDMDKRLAEMRKNNMRRAPGAPGGAPRPVKPARPVAKTVVKPKSVIKEKPEKPDVDVDEFAAPPVKAKPVKEKPVREKPVKEKPEKPAKEKRGLFGRKKSAPEEQKTEELDEDDGDIIFDDVEDETGESGDLFSKEDMKSSLDELFNEEEEKKADDGIDGIRDIKDIEVKKIDEGRLEELERDDEDKDMKIFKPKREIGRFDKSRFKGPGPDLSELDDLSFETDAEENTDQQENIETSADSGFTESKTPAGKDIFAEDDIFIDEEKAAEDKSAGEEADTGLPDTDHSGDKAKNRKEMRDRNIRDNNKEILKNDVFDPDENDAELPDRNEGADMQREISEADRTSVLRKEIERNATSALPGDAGNTEKAGLARRTTGTIPTPPPVNKIKRRPVNAAPVAPSQAAEAPMQDNDDAAVQPGVPGNAAQRRRPVAGAQNAAKAVKGERPSMPPVNIPANVPANVAANAPVNAPGARRPMQKRPGQPQNPAQPGQSQAQGQNPAFAQKNNQQIRTIRNANAGGVRPLKQNAKGLPENTENTAIISAPAVAAAAAQKPKKPVPPRQSGVERKKEAGRREFESRRRNLNEDDFKESSFPIQIISYVAVAIIVIIALICAFRGIEFNTLSPLVLGIISVIMVVMGIFLGMIPSFITLLIAAAALVAGSLTGFFSEVVSALVVLLATVTALKGRKG